MTTGSAKPRQLRCAIYTRKSTEEGLEQDFNTLDAQREACEAYVLSQRQEGWTLLPAFYDDGGFSGGTMERPALKQLLADMEDGKIDVVVVYKVDRLTRSLTDFARIVDIFDAGDASFVSVTQAFNTTTSMGRLTLNVLLSFAQFEREVTGERIRDKIAASKKKGMWMGGLPPLGLDARDRKLVVNDAEAETVRHIFRSYLALGSVDLLQRTLGCEGVVSKKRTNKHGRTSGGNPFARGALYHMLQSQLYIGRVPHKDQSYPGEHEAIIPMDLWEAVQSALEKNRHNRANGTNCKAPSLLAGFLHDDAGNRMVPSHAVRRGKRYRYYVSASGNTRGREPSEGKRRLPAGEIEGLVQSRIRLFLTSASELHSTLDPVVCDAENQARIIEQASRLSQHWREGSQADIRADLLVLSPHITVSDEEVRIAITPSLLLALLKGSAQPNKRIEGSGAERPVVLTIKARLRRSGIGAKLHITASDRDPDPHLVALMARAHQMRDLVLQSEDATLKGTATRLHISPSWLTRILRLTWLAPDIVKSILNGSQPPELTARQLLLDTRFPLDWEAQRQHLGFNQNLADT
jgi:DNA invertase Pin-like site-specific DNA recombinase